MTIYKQAGGSPAPASDTVIGAGEMWIVSDSEVAVDDPANFKADVSALASQASVDAIPTAPLLAADYTAPDNAGITRLLGLALENHVEDDVVRDPNGNKTSSIIYLYDSAAAVGTHVSGGGPGLVAKYNMTATYSVNNRMTDFKVTKV